MRASEARPNALVSAGERGGRGERGKGWRGGGLQLLTVCGFLNIKFQRLKGQYHEIVYVY